MGVRKETLGAVVSPKQSYTKGEKRGINSGNKKRGKRECGRIESASAMVHCSAGRISLDFLWFWGWEEGGGMGD